MGYKLNVITGNLDLVDSGVAGAVVGPDSATDNSIVIFDGTTGRLVKDSGVSVTELQTDITNAQDDATEALDLIASLPDPITYKGTWNATTNTPTLLNTDIDKNGFLYQVNVAGTTNFGAGNISFEVGDKVVNNGTIWDKWDMTDSVNSVNGEYGVVVLKADDINRADDSETIEESLDDLSIAVTAAQNDATDALTNADAAQTDIDNEIIRALAAEDILQDNIDAEELRAIAAEDDLQDQIDAIPVAPSGDIQAAAFSMTNNQAVAANVTGLAFGSLIVRGFTALVTVEIDATSDIYTHFTLSGINKNGSFNMSSEALGDVSGVVFSITSGGQVQYTSTNQAGFSTGFIKFRAITLSI